MSISTIILSLSLGLNLALVIFFFFKLRKKPPEHVLTRDATQLLSELSKGGAVVVTQVLDPAQIFQWSPRGE